MNTQSNQSISASTQPVDSLPEPTAAAAFERHQSRFLALVPAELTVVNTDVPVAITVVLGALLKTAQFRERVARLPKSEIDHELLAMLEDLTGAMQHAQGIFDAASAPADHIVAIADRGMKLRALLIKVLDLFVDLGVIDAKVLAGIKVGSGYRDLAADLIAVAELISQHWSAIEGRAPVDKAMLTEARALGEAIYRSMGIRQGSDHDVNAAADTRQRVFTLFARAYDQMRRAISFLRWEEGDLNEIAPSIYTRAPTSRNKETAPAPKDPVNAPVAPIVSAPSASPSPNGIPVGNGVAPFTR